MFDILASQRGSSGRPHFLFISMALESIPGAPERSISGRKPNTNVKVQGIMLTSRGFVSEPDHVLFAILVDTNSISI